MTNICSICGIKTSNNFFRMAENNFIYASSDGRLCKGCEKLWITGMEIIPQAPNYDKEKQEQMLAKRQLGIKKCEGVQGKNEGKEEE